MNSAVSFDRTPLASPKGGQFVLHSQTLHGNLFDGHPLGSAVADI